MEKKSDYNMTLEKFEKGRSKNKMYNLIETIQELLRTPNLDEQNISFLNGVLRKCFTIVGEEWLTTINNAKDE